MKDFGFLTLYNSLIMKGGNTMIKPQYSVVLESYTENILWLESAFEAAEEPVTKMVNDTNKSKITNNTADEDPTKSNSPLTKKTFGNVLKGILETLKNLISKWSIKLKNRLKMMMNTNKGYIKQLNDRMKTVKPGEAIKVVTYAYNIPMIERVYNGVSKQYSTIMNNILNVIANIDKVDPNNVLDGKKDNDLIQDMIQAGFKNNSLDSPNKFFTFIRDQFRGESKEILYRREQLPAIIKLSQDYQALSAKLGKEHANANRELNRIKALETKMLYNGNNADKSKLCNDLVKVATKVRNFYQSFISYYMELKLEQILSYRAIVKRFYQF